MSGRSIRRQARRVAGKNDMHGEMPFMEPAGGLESVAAVVARPGQNEYRTAIVTAQACRQLGSGPSGAVSMRRSAGVR